MEKTIKIFFNNVLITNLKQSTMKKRVLPFLMFMLITSMGFAQTHTLLVTVPDSIETVYVAGAFNGWNPASDSLTQISDSPKKFSFQYTYEGSVDSLEYKFLAGPDWKYQQKDGANFMVKNDSATAVVDTFNAVYHHSQAKDVMIDVLVPVEVFRLYLTGTFNGWSPSVNQMVMVDSTANGKEFQLTIHSIDTTTLEFKFLSGPGWPYQQVAGNYNYMNDGGTVVCDEFKKIFDPAKVGDITINITVPEGTPEVWVVGSFGAGWSMDDAIQATKNEDGTYTAVVPLVADIEYKIWNHNDWAYEEAKNAAGDPLDANRTASFETGPVFDITVLYWKKVFGAPSGVKDPISAAYKMYTVNGTIVVEGVTSNVSVYDINGRMMQSVRAKGNFVSRSLQPGIYILRVDNKVQKVAVQ
jgi:hypothetical protein